MLAMKHEAEDEITTQEATDNTVTRDNYFESRGGDEPIWDPPACAIFEKTPFPKQQHLHLFMSNAEQHAGHTGSSYTSLSTHTDESADGSLSVPIKLEEDIELMCMGSSTLESADNEQFRHAPHPAVTQNPCLEPASQKAGPSLAPARVQRPTADRRNTEDYSLCRNTLRPKKLLSVWRTSLKLFVCSTCNRGFSRLSQLEEHKATHQTFKPFRCLECGKSFTQKTRLKTHQSVHTGERPFSCKICGKMFSRQDNCLRHERFHSGLKPHSCEQCGKSFTVLSNLKIHRENHKQGR